MTLNRNMLVANVPISKSLTWHHILPPSSLKTSASFQIKNKSFLHFLRLTVFVEIVRITPFWIIKMYHLRDMKVDHTITGFIAFNEWTTIQMILKFSSHYSFLIGLKLFNEKEFQTSNFFLEKLHWNSKTYKTYMFNVIWTFFAMFFSV